MKGMTINKMKEIMAAALAAMHILSLTACGDNDSKTTSKDSKPTQSEGSVSGGNSQGESSVNSEAESKPISDNGETTPFKVEDNDNGVTIIGYTGDGGNIEIPNKIGGKPMTKIGNSAFYDCEGITSINFPNNDATEIGKAAFSGCKSLTSVIIPDSVTVIGSDAFWRCQSLSSVTIPDSVTKIGERAFEYCESIQATYKGNTYDPQHINDLYTEINGN